MRPLVISSIARNLTYSPLPLALQDVSGTRQSPKRSLPREDPTECRAVRLKWVKEPPRTPIAGEEGMVRSKSGLVLESFEMVPDFPAEEPPPDPELSIAAANLLASIIEEESSRRATSDDVIVTATVPLVCQEREQPLAREILAPLMQERLDSFEL